MNENTDGSGVGGFGIGGVFTFGGGRPPSGTVVAGNNPDVVGCAAGVCPGSFQSNLPFIIIGIVVVVLILR
jgi:hypothetical protein